MAYGGQSEKDRFRSFAERYVIARAPMFRLGHEKEDAWQAVQDAKTMYEHVHDVGDILEAHQYVIAEGDANVGVATQQQLVNTPPAGASVNPNRGRPVTVRDIHAAQERLLKPTRRGLKPMQITDFKDDDPVTVDSDLWTGLGHPYR